MATYWTLSQAIAWTATQSEDEVAEAPLTIVHLALAESSTPDAGARYFEAKAKLWRALQDGALVATGIGGDGRRGKIAPELWIDLQAFLNGSIERLSSNATPTGDSFSEVRLSAADVVQWLRRDGRSVSGSTPGQKRTRRNQAGQLADLISRKWPEGQPVGMKVVDWERQIWIELKAAGWPNLSDRTLQRARQLAKSRLEASRRE